MESMKAPSKHYKIGKGQALKCKVDLSEQVSLRASLQMGAFFLQALALRACNLFSVLYVEGAYACSVILKVTEY